MYTMSLQTMSSIIFRKSLLGVVLALAVLVIGCIGNGVEDVPARVPMGSLWYPVYGYDRDTGECLGGLGSAGWNDGGPPVIGRTLAGLLLFRRRRLPGADHRIDAGVRSQLGLALLERLG